MQAASPTRTTQYPEIERVDRDPTDSGFDPLKTESKYTLACDAIAHSKLHAVDSANAYLDTALQVLRDLPIVHGREGLFDARVLAAIDRSARTTNEYRGFIELVAESGDLDTLTPVIIKFLEGVLALKKHYRLAAHDAYLWRDSLRFVCREIFVCTTATFLAHQHWSAVKTLIEHKYQVNNIEQSFGYTEFDGFLTTIDVFRNRRLNLERVSLTADLLQDRVATSNVLFDDVMQADFVLHLYSRLHQPRIMKRWIARTLCHADEQCINGFGLFIMARGDSHKECLPTLFGVKDWAELMSQVASFCEGVNIANNPQLLDYAGFIGNRSSLFSH